GRKLDSAFSLAHLCFWRSPGIQRDRLTEAGGGGDSSGEESATEIISAVDTRDRRLCRQQLLGAAAGPVCHTAGGGAAGGGDDRYRVRGGLDSGRAGNHAERVHRVHVECVCDCRAAIHVFCGRGLDAVVRVSALWAVDGTDIDWREDAGVALLRGADGSSAGDSGGGDRAFGGGFGGVAAER